MIKFMESKAVCEIMDSMRGTCDGYWNKMLNMPPGPYEDYGCEPEWLVDAAWELNCGNVNRAEMRALLYYWHLLEQESYNVNLLDAYNRGFDLLRVADIVERCRSFEQGHAVVFDCGTYPLSIPECDVADMFLEGFRSGFLHDKPLMVEKALLLVSCGMLDLGELRHALRDGVAGDYLLSVDKGLEILTAQRRLRDLESGAAYRVGSVVVPALPEVEMPRFDVVGIMGLVNAQLRGITERVNTPRR